MPHITRVACQLILVLILGYSAAGSAQTREEWRTTEQNDASGLELKQNYTGVTPGSGNTLPKVTALKGKSGNWVTWPGFSMLDNGGSRIFLQTTAALTYQVVKKKRGVTLKFAEVKVFLSNNRNPLITTHFNTPLRRAYLKRRHKSVELVMELKVAVEPAISQTVDKDGYHYMFIDFPAGRYPVAELRSATTTLSTNDLPSPSGQSTVDAQTTPASP